MTSGASQVEGYKHGRTAFTTGLTYDHVDASGFTLSGSVLYQQRGSFGKVKRTTEEYTYNYIALPLRIGYTRNGTFEPVLVPKRSTKAEGVENIIISLYARGMSVRDIEEQIRDIYGFNISESTISNVTARVQSHITEWQSRPLSPVYFVVWMDGIVFKVRQNGKVINKTIYLAVGLTDQGLKEVLGMRLGENESASFWMSVLTDLRSRGVEDILITRFVWYSMCWHQVRCVLVENLHAMFTNIIKLKDDFGKAFDLTNLMAVCRACHAYLEAGKEII